jgi:rSAM/selenodomain-associated transferase 1
MSAIEPVAIAILAKAPIPGFAKTRLIPLLGAGGAARLQAKLIRHTVNCCRDAATGPVELWVTPDTDHACFRACAEIYGTSLFLQRGGDLGERMRHALSSALGRSRAALLVGTDAPTLCPEDLRQGADALIGGYDAVISPALDGGYVLIGLRRADPRVFAGIDWGTGRVLSQTRERFTTLGWRWEELNSHEDIDRPEDWLRLCAALPEWQQRVQGEPPSA